MERNAIILAAGKSNRFAPFTYEKPKGLFKVRGEILIERQIEQLEASGVNKIYIVVGYMKEKFFYLEQKYGVELIVNNNFEKKGNLYSLYVAREHMKNTFICCADHYFVNNPFLYENEKNESFRACVYLQGKFQEFAVECSNDGTITKMSTGGKDCLAMVGHAYINEEFSRLYRKLMETEIEDFGVAGLFWEEFYARHIEELKFVKYDIDVDDFREFEGIDELTEFDSEFLSNVDSDIIDNICNTFNCRPSDVSGIEVINAGLTNVSFVFSLKGDKYVYRHPGGTSGNLINRETEVYVQKIAKEIGLDSSVIKISPHGWKISHYISGAHNCNFEQSERQLRTAMKYLSDMHSVKVDGNIKVFDNLEEGKRLIKIASLTKGNLESEFSELIHKAEKLYEYIKKDAKRLGYPLVLCHNDMYESNFLEDDDGKLYLIDWEYAGLNYAANDVCGMPGRYELDDEQTERYFEAYFGRELTADEARFYNAFVPINSFYWFCWGLYKGSVGDGDGFFFLPSYRNAVRRMDRAIESYERDMR